MDNFSYAIMKEAILNKEIYLTQEQRDKFCEVIDINSRLAKMLHLKIMVAKEARSPAEVLFIKKLRY